MGVVIYSLMKEDTSRKLIFMNKNSALVHINVTHSEVGLTSKAAATGYLSFTKLINRKGNVISD